MSKLAGTVFGLCCVDGQSSHPNWHLIYFSQQVPGNPVIVILVKPQSVHVGTSWQGNPLQDNYTVTARSIAHAKQIKPRGVFFPSGLAVNALWHGPDRYISGEKSDTQHNWLVSKSKAYQYTNKTNNQPRQDDPQIPQPDLRFASSKAKQQENGAGPKQKHPHLMPFSTVAFSHCK